MNIVQAMRDPGLFGPFFRDLSTWRAAIVLLKATLCIPMDVEELEVFRQHTGRERPPRRQVFKALWLIGRRAGKSFLSAMIAVFMSCFRDHSSYLAPGERAVVMVISADRATAGIVFGYINAFLGIEMLKPLIVRRTRDTIDLSNGVSIEVRTASYRTTRGRTVLCCICDELAFWQDGESSANPAAEIISAVEPGMANVPDPLFVKITTPRSRTGVVWDFDRRYYGVDDDNVIVWKSDSRSMNPTVPQSVIERAFEEDESVAWSEYGRDGEIRFRADLEGYITRDAVESCVVPGRFELPPVPGVSYRAFTDPSGGSHDSFALAVVHMEKEVAVLDCIRERRPPFSPEQVVAEFSETLKAYRVREVTGDRYAGEWPREQFRKHGIEYRTADKPKSDLYLQFLPMLNSGHVALLDHKGLVSQLCGLERRTARGGRDSVDHGPNGRDDVSNCVAGVVSLVSQPAVLPGIMVLDWGDDVPERGWRRIGRIPF